MQLIYRSSLKMYIYYAIKLTELIIQFIQYNLCVCVCVSLNMQLHRVTECKGTTLQKDHFRILDMSIYCEY